MKTLIIEHDKQLLEDITSILKTRWPHCQYFSIEQGIEGIDMVDMTNPDLVILDLDGLDNDGLETIREIRKVSIVPLVVLSRVKDDGSSVAKALYHGADRFIKKPFRALEFLSRVNHSSREYASSPMLCSNATRNIGQECVVFSNPVMYRYCN